MGEEWGVASNMKTESFSSPLFPDGVGTYFEIGMVLGIERQPARRSSSPSPASPMPHLCAVVWLAKPLEENKRWRLQ